MNQNIEDRNAGWMWIAFGLVLVVFFFGFMLLSMHNAYRGGYGMGWGAGPRAGYWNHMPMYSGQSWSGMPMYNGRYAGRNWQDMPMYNGRYPNRDWSGMPMYNIMINPENTTQSKK